MTVDCRASRLTFLVACLFGFLSPESVVAQDKGQRFSDWAHAIESKTPYTFYYEQEEMDSVTVNFKDDDRPLPTLLTELFSSTPFNFTIDRHNNVFITYGWVIQTDFSGFFSRGAHVNSALPDSLRADKEIIIDYSSEGQSERIEEKLLSIGIKTNVIKAGTAVLSGRVLQEKSHEPLINANVILKKPFIGVSTDQLGYFSITLPKGRLTLFFSSVGMRETQRNIILYSNGKLDVELQESVQSLKEVVILSDRDKNLARTEMGVEKLDIKRIKQIPTALGEADVIRALLTLPGVNSVGEVSSGFNVRGGGADQNLVLFNDAVVYNPAHLFGFFPAFNPDLIKDVELYKSSIPARFGGRLASILDIHSREGNKRKFVGSGGIGPVTGRLTLEGPIFKEKTSFLLSGRANYSNWLLRYLPNEAYRNSKASFYDINAGISHQIDEKNKLFLSAYYSSDRFRFKDDTTYSYRNYNTSLKWTRIFSEKLFGNVTGSLSHYDYSMESEHNPATAFILKYAINQAQLKADFNYQFSSVHAFDFGVSTLHYKLMPGSYTPNSTGSRVEPDLLEREYALESAVYFSDKISVSPSMAVDIGFRYSVFNYLGPKTITDYASGLPKSELTKTGTHSYGSGKIINTYQGPEFRAALRKSLSENSSVKMSYNAGRQYLHLLSNTAAISPTDVWKLSDPHIHPQLGQQYSAGYYRNFRQGLFETSFEVYYKTSKNYLDYKSGAALTMNHNLETDVISTRGRAYGAELLLRKTAGKLNGWMSYTYSRSFLQADDSGQETVNDGRWYPSNFDKPNNFTLAGNYKFNHRFNISLNVTYSTGRPITLPVAQYVYEGSYRVFYSNRNEYRIPDYFRTDFSMNIEGNHKIKKLAHSSWTLAVYNLTGRKNPYSVYFNSSNGTIEGYKLSILGHAIPTVTYNFRF